MENFKEKFFNQGFISNLKVIDEIHAKTIFDNYTNYLKKGINKASSIEHKTKSHLFFPWANELIKNQNILKYDEK